MYFVCQLSLRVYYSVNCHSVYNIVLDILDLQITKISRYQDDQFWPNMVDQNKRVRPTTTT